jgi:hypothetical protein
MNNHPFVIRARERRFLKAQRTASVGLGWLSLGKSDPSASVPSVVAPTCPACGQQIPPTSTACDTCPTPEAL